MDRGDQLPGFSASSTDTRHCTISAPTHFSTQSLHLHRVSGSLPAATAPQLTLRVLRRLVQGFGFLYTPFNGHHKLLIYRGDMKTNLRTLLLYGKGSWKHSCPRKLPLHGCTRQSPVAEEAQMKAQWEEAVVQRAPWGHLKAGSHGRMKSEKGKC